MTAEDRQQTADGRLQAVETKRSRKKYPIFNKTIYNQTLKSNWKLWMIFTAILCLFIAVSSAVYNPITMGRMKEMLKSFGGEAAERMGGLNLSMTGILAQMFFGMMAVVLPMIYILITANSLIASKVDRGSMAYTLSTPIKRKTVAFTNATYLISMIVAMFAIISVVGLVTVQIAHGSVFGTAYTADVKVIAKQVGKKPSAVEADLRKYILDGKTLQEALADYADESNEFGAVIDKAMKARRMKDAEVYITYIDARIAQKNAPNGTGAGSGEPPFGLTEEQMQNQYMAALTKAANALGLGLSDIMNDLSRVKAPAALTAAAEEFFQDMIGVTLTPAMAEAMFRGIINGSLASSQIGIDEGYKFETSEFMLMMLGALLFALATAGIAFFFSCFFNLSKHSIALGAGIPIGFYLLQTISTLDSSLDKLKYLSLNTLFDPTLVTSGGTFWWQYVILGAVSVTLFTLSIFKFKKKDLPL